MMLIDSVQKPIQRLRMQYSHLLFERNDYKYHIMKYNIYIYIVSNINATPKFLYLHILKLPQSHNTK